MKYDKPKLDIIVFATEDVIRTSKVTDSSGGDDEDNILDDF